MTKDEIIYALCEDGNKCPNCFREIVGSACTGCNEYYPECCCKPLTPQQIKERDYQLA